MSVNKVIYNGTTLVDLTGDTVIESSLLKGYTAHKADGTVIEGTIKPDQVIPTGAEEQIVLQTLDDSDGNTISDSIEENVEGQNIYRLV